MPMDTALKPTAWFDLLAAAVTPDDVVRVARDFVATWTPQEIAGLFVFLASRAGAYVNGQALVIDGGELAGGLASAGVQ